MTGFYLYVTGEALEAKKKQTWLRIAQPLSPYPTVLLGCVMLLRLGWLTPQGYPVYSLTWGDTHISQSRKLLIHSMISYYL